MDASEQLLHDEQVTAHIKEQEEAWSVCWGWLALLLFGDPTGSALNANTWIWQSAYELAWNLVEQDDLLKYFCEKERKAYTHYIAALKERGIEIHLVDTGGGCVALSMEVGDGKYIYTLGPSMDDRYNGFEVMNEDGDIIAAYEPPNLYDDINPVETANLLAPALHRFLKGDKTPLTGWNVKEKGEL